MSITLRCGDTIATIALTGAELKSWQVGGRELMWHGDAGSWPRSAPLLFPVVGWCREGVVRVDGKTYPMPVHGFAPTSRFAIVEQTESRAVLTLRDSDDTRAHYPFAFELTVEMELRADAFSLRAMVRNTDTRPLPYAFGLHPGFRWPFAADGAYTVEFAAPESPDVPVIGYGGVFTAERRTIPLEGKVLPMSHELMRRDALCFLNAKSRSMTFRAPDGAAIATSYDNLPHLALWSRNGARYLCLEAWSGHGDPEGFAGDMFAKPAMSVLQPGAGGDHRALYRFLASAT